MQVWSNLLCSGCLKAAVYHWPVPFIAGSISTANGSALVRMGGTMAICGVKAVSATLLTHMCTHTLSPSLGK